MKATELRIGNYLHYSDTPKLKPHLINSDFQITADDILYISENPNIDFVEAIPLTEEWKGRFVWQLVRNNEYHINSFFSIIGTGLYYMNDFTGIQIPYVHTLQNLVHSLTGEELTILTPKS